MTVKEYPTPVEIEIPKKKTEDHEPNPRSKEELNQRFVEDSCANGRIVDLEGNVRDLDEDLRSY